MTFSTPGVYVNETTLPNFAESGSRIAIGAFVGTSAQGPVVPTAIESWNDYVRLYGGFPTSAQSATELPWAVYNFFSNGGRRCWVLRVVGTGSATATLDLVDRAATSQLTVKVDAKSPGLWGNSLYIEVKSRDDATGRFDLFVYLGGTTDAYIKERFLDVTIDSGDPQYVISKINSVTAGSQYISVTSYGSATSFPSNAPKVISPTQLASGLDGAAANVTEVQTAISLLDEVTGPFLLNLPGNSTAAVNTAITYAQTRGDVFVIVDTPSGNDAAAAISYAGALSPQSSFAAVYYPWVTMVDAAGGGNSRLCPPGPAVMGVYIQTDQARGPFKTPAGTNARIAGALQLERKLTDADTNLLNDANVNAIRNLPGAGICIMGGRTLKKTSIDRYVSVRRSLIFLRETFKDVTAYAVFEPNDPKLWSSISVRLAQVCSQFWQAGGLKGNSASEAYYVKCDGELNTQLSINQGEVRAEVGVSLQQPAEFIVITIGQWDGGSNITDSITVSV